ncbi:hypothetical protein NIES4071_90360 [Calothrix sp. NIES-4071]|nr:hypothetical protein NIES4071_90360 [Calothrix sp. NIES-4071]BAZ63303.1 hypothetical protein NIES4105_90290 [Calothrix sp. NIES-4105]
MCYSTSKLEISDLSFCEVAVEKIIEITGGLFFAGNSPYLYEYLSQQLFRILPLELEGYQKKEIYSEPGTVVNKLENTQAGLSGYEVLSDGGRSRTVVLSGSNSAKSISTASNFSYLL